MVRDLSSAENTTNNVDTRHKQIKKDCKQHCSQQMFTFLGDTKQQPFVILSYSFFIIPISVSISIVEAILQWFIKSCDW